MRQYRLAAAFLSPFALTFALAGCSSSNDLAGTWQGTEHDQVVLHIYDDGNTAAAMSEDESCRGKLDTDSSPYKINLDCVAGPDQQKTIATIKPTDDNRLIQFTVPGPGLDSPTGKISLKRVSDTPDYQPTQTSDPY